MNNINKNDELNKFEISFDFAEKYFPYEKPKFIQIFLYAKYLICKTHGPITVDTVSEAMGLDQTKTKYRLEYWVKQGELVINENGEYTLPSPEFALSQSPKSIQTKTTHQAVKSKTSKKTATRMRPSYTSEEINAASEKNPELGGLFGQAENILGHLLSGNDMELLYSFHDWLGLPCEVITMMLTYASKRGITGKRYLETLAIKWSDNGIDSYEKAEDYITKLEKIDGNEHKIRNVLGIYDRALSQTEKKYINTWTTEMNLNPELVALAYDKTVENTGKLSWAYMNKILKSWQDEGIKDVDGVKRSDEIHNMVIGKNKYQNKSESKKPAAQKSKFNNFDSTDKTDYEALNEKIFDMFLDNQ